MSMRMLLEAGQRRNWAGEFGEGMEIVLVGHHENVGKKIEEWEQAGWRLHSYQATGDVGLTASFVNHYLLFVRGE